VSETDRKVPPIRVLLIEDRIPDPSLGSGYPRMIDTIAELQNVVGAKVSLFPTFGVNDGERAHLPDDVDLIDVPLEDHLVGHRAFRGKYSAVIISRPHNYQRVAKVVRAVLPGVPVIYDAEALYFRRLERQADLATGAVRQQLLREARAMQALEERIAAESDAVVCISADEAELLSRKTVHPVVVNGPLLAAAAFTEQDFFSRQNVGFVAGWSAGPNAPNVDGLRWFARHVWPRVLARMPGAKLLVTGDAPPREVLRFACESIEFVGRVNDLEDFYAGIRVAVVPVRYGSGVKLKAVEALQFGVPTVATAIGAESIPSDVDGLLAVVDDTGEFADEIAALYLDVRVWQAQREILRIQADAWSEHRPVSIWPALFERVLVGGVSL
jgi:O-antigen biosynthesis protein